MAVPKYDLHRNAYDGGQIPKDVRTRHGTIPD